MVIDLAVALPDQLGPLPTGDEAEPAPSREEPEPTAPRTGPPRPGPLAIALALVLVASVAAGFLGVFAFGLSALQEQRSQHLLYAELRGLLDPSSTVAPSIGGAIPEGRPVALLNAPGAGLHDVVVVEGTSSGDLLAGPGHLADTPLPGQAGESVLLGKSATAGAPFAGITRLRAGDRITVRTGQGLFHFRVKGQFVAGDRLPTITTAAGLLTLATVAGSGGPGRLASDHLVYVVATLEGKVAATPPGRPATVPAAQAPGHADLGAWPLVALWLAALLAGSAACWWLWRRWGILRTWFVGAPVLFGILWGFSIEAMRLFPNVY